MQPKKKSSRRNVAIQMSQEEMYESLEPLPMRGFSFLRRNLGTPTIIPYDPHKHRHVEHPMSDLEAFINLLKCAFGTGCLAMPRAFYNAGWLNGLISTILIGSFVVYGMHLLISDINTLCKRHRIPVLSYSEAMELAILSGPSVLHPLSKWLSYQVDFFLAVYHFGVDTVYVIFIAKNIKTLADMYFIPIDARIYMAVLTVPLILTFLIRNLKHLVPFSIISNILMLISLILISTYLFTDLPSLEERRPIQNFSQFPLFFGTIVFAIEAMGLILSLQLNMTTPQNYLGTFGVLNKAMFFVVIFYAGFGFLGYWKFGDDTANSLLDNLPMNDILPQCIMGMFALAIFFSYAIQGYVAFEIIWRNHMQPWLTDDPAIPLQYMVRIAMVLASVLCAILYPNFGLLLALLGSFCLAQVGLIYPGIVNMCVTYSEGYGPYNVLFWRSFLFIFMGLVGGLAGTVVSIKEAF